MNDLLSLFIGGENRIVLPLLLYPFILIIPAIVLSGLIVIPHDKLPSVLRQILSIPLLLAVLLTPFAFTTVNKAVELVVGVANYNFFLRFFELYWVGPLLQHRPVYASTESLWIDFWGCLRTFPKPAKDLKKQYTKDKKYYHILIKLFIHAIVADVICSWMTTFTSNEFCATWFERPMFFLFIFAMANLLLNSAFNCAGYSLQLFYCLAFEGGSYSSEQWRSLMIHPIMSGSLDELWSTRWHQLFKSTWLAFPFRPVRILIMRLLNKRVRNAKAIGFIFASVAVFAASAGMHEYVIAANMGFPIYNRVFRGEQCKFFLSHGMGVFFEHILELVLAPQLSQKFKDSYGCYWIKRIWTMAFGYGTFFYIFHGFVSWGFQFDSPLQFSQPLIVDLVRAFPILRDFVGSNILI